MKKEVYMRVDGDARTGLGHFFRCMALAEFLEAHFKIIFVSQRITPNLISKIRKKYIFFKIEEEIDFFKVLREDSLVVVDGYQFGKTFFQELKSFKIKIISIQDKQRFHENVDLVINHLPDVEKYYQNVDILAGPKYALIRKKILKQPISSRMVEEGYLISLGGTDNYSFINQIVDLIKQIDTRETIRVLTTEENSKKINSEGLQMYFDQDEDAILQLIDNSRFCLITSGMISYEVLARNKRAVVGALNEGQVKIAEEFEEMGLVEFVGCWKDINLKKLEKALKGNNIKLKSVENIFDGKSDERIMEKFLQL